MTAMTPLRLWRLFRLHLRWRKARRRGRTLRLRIGNVAGFLSALNEARIPYAVLRWFEEVPLNGSEEAALSEDIDFLIDHGSLSRIVDIASRHPGEIRCDFYSPTGKRGTGYKKMPYYPPVLGQQILSHRLLYRDAFFIPEPLTHFQSLAYHLVYHKGTTSGLATGTPEVTGSGTAKRPYQQLIESLGDSLQLPLEKPYTLLSLHRYLQQSDWAMPYDLMLRWPKEKPWIGYLASIEEARYQPFAGALPDLVVFLIRADATGDPALEAATTDLIANHFHVLKTVRLDETATGRVVRSTRGGNWLEHGGTVFVPPALALICNDPNPKPFAADDPRRRKYPLISNVNVLKKNAIRDLINKRFPDPAETRIVLHGSDNALEAQHHLEAVYGSDYPDICRELEAEILS